MSVTGTGVRPASAAIAASSPRSVRMGGWIPRARSRSSARASALRRRASASSAARPQVGFELLLGHAEAHAERDQTRLRAVVQVPLDPAELGLLHVDRSCAGRLELLDPVLVRRAKTPPRDDSDGAARPSNGHAARSTRRVVTRPDGTRKATISAEMPPGWRAAGSLRSPADLGPLEDEDDPGVDADDSASGSSVQIGQKYPLRRERPDDDEQHAGCRRVERAQGSARRRRAAHLAGELDRARSARRRAAATRRHEAPSAGRGGARRH